VRKWLYPERQADRLILAVTELMDKSPTPSAFANGVMIDWLDPMAEEERFTPAARQAATYAIYAGYALRMVEEAEAPLAHSTRIFFNDLSGYGLTRRNATA
jgi:hypothetical protein